MFGFQFLDAFLQLGDLGLELPVFLFQVGNASGIAFLLGRFLLGRFDGRFIGRFGFVFHRGISFGLGLVGLALKGRHLQNPGVLVRAFAVEQSSPVKVTPCRISKTGWPLKSRPLNLRRWVQ